MIPFVSTSPSGTPVPIWPVRADALSEWQSAQPASVAAWTRAAGFKATAGETCLVPGPDGGLAGVALGLGDSPDMWACGELSRRLPEGEYRLEGDAVPAEAAALAWALGGYAFTRYRKDESGRATLILPNSVDAGRVARVAAGVGLTRDLVNTPASDMGPAELAGAAQELAERHGARCSVTVGDDLLSANYPAIHAVGRASAQAPRLIDLAWGDAGAPKLTLVGKGVCFDSGGLDLKPAAAMLRMKKDMGGAANVLGLAHMVMDAGLPVRLRVLIPAVENAVSGSAFRPGDILTTRKGLTVEVGNTDAEGRIVLCDALAEADQEEPALLVDCATLTGAARTALGPDLPAMFTDDDQLAADVARHGTAAEDPVWRMPLYAPYMARLKSEVADLNNVSEGPMAGAITAALYLKSFVERTRSWAHFDLYAWNDKARPGRPAGGEAMAIRALYGLIEERWGGA